MSHYLRRIFGSRFARVILDYTTRLDLGYASASISYFALLSIFPAVIVLGSFFINCWRSINNHRYLPERYNATFR